MERLTVPDEKIEGGWRRAVIDTREVRKEAMTIYWALKKYEDTGLTPPEVQELKERDTAKKPEVIVVKNDVEIGAITFKPGTKVYKCPNCGRLVIYGDRHCRDCGQQLKWED